MKVPEALTASYHRTDWGRAWLAALPDRTADALDRWELRPDGPVGSGMASLVLPVVRVDGTPAVLKLQPVTEDNAAAPIGLRTWDGDGAVRLLDHEPGAMLLERLDASRPLSSVADDEVAMGVLADLLARLVAVRAPAGVRRLADIAADMLDQVPAAEPALRSPADRSLLRTCASAVAEVVGEAGDRLLHWDLHHDNVLAGAREPWLAIDPEPLSGDPGFDLLPALDGRWDTVVATGDVPRTTLRRFDQLTAATNLDRPRATAWTLARVLQNALWDIEDGETALNPTQVTIARVLLDHRT
ncbi:aminoglycoside phosphotransferase family protein [Saccharothrix sp. S26]|uniref:aminoglycoside phosphotransferase family protein n=1 Tax=Saccharothrix sp. S26 TaxID=2907215 RepID=UPI001F453AD0|nr:aminoglycoside phosphotransferase family protein [Saccharothrix sp. S26]MCE7001153.1 aminoglycoside phosphotransferase family protein [Saccharothrix sp. S26]